jgi:hypothetical protein
MIENACAYFTTRAASEAPSTYPMVTLLQVLQNYYWNKRNYTAVTLGKANAMTVVPNQYGYANLRRR